MKDKYSYIQENIFEILSRHNSDKNFFRRQCLSFFLLFLRMPIFSRTSCFHLFSFHGSRSLLSAIMLYSTVFSTKLKEGANQTEIATLLSEDGYANTGLTFLWYVLFPHLPSPLPFRILFSAWLTHRKTDKVDVLLTLLQNSPFHLGLQQTK